MNDVNKPVRPELVFISWAPYCSRSDSIAARLDGQSFMVYSPRWGSNYLTAPVKYLMQTLKTIRILLRTRPKIVIVMAPPVIACLPVWLYAKLFGAKYAIDAHTAAFMTRPWSRLQWLQRFFSKRAATTIVTNPYLRDIVEDWGAAATVITDVPVQFAAPNPMQLPSGCNMTMVCSFCADEPIEEFLSAAALAPDVNFYLTGNYHKLKTAVLAKKPRNVTFLGFLSDAEYVGQLLASDAVIALTTRDHTMQRAAYEAIYLGKPVITSDFEILRTCFDKGTVHVRPTVEGILEGIEKIRDNFDLMRSEAEVLRHEKLKVWERVAADLRAGFDLFPASRLDENTLPV